MLTHMHTLSHTHTGHIPPGARTLGVVAAAAQEACPTLPASRTGGPPHTHTPQHQHTPLTPRYPLDVRDLSEHKSHFLL